MNIFTRILCLALLFSALLFLALQTPIKSQSSSVQQIVTAEAEKISGDKFRFSQKTPKGVKIYAVKKPRIETLLAIDKGFDNLFAIARSTKYKYKKRLRHSDYTIYIARADRIKTNSGKYIPVFAVKANQYAGSKYDKGGFIYAAGIVVAFNPCAFMIAEHNKKFELVSNIVSYEGEHLVLYHNNRKYFKQTADHSKGGGHPILK